ncbi:MAG TPA: hypothetical protein VNK82_03190 [Terriglobales bacterium]|nr:hypothetical protein [Terriglobales bacterium]
MALLAGLAVLLAAPVWMAPYPPLVDYSNHLARAFILAHPDDPGLARYYAADWGLRQYLLLDLALVALQKLVSIDVAGRLLLTLTALVLPPAVWFFLRAASPAHEWLAAWSLLLCHNFFFLTGLVNLQLSLAMCFLTLGVWLRYVERPSAGRWSVLALCATLAYCTHVMGFAVAVLAAAWLTLRVRHDRGAVARAAAAFLPGLLLLVVSSSGAADSTVQYGSLGARPLVPLIAIEAYSQPLDYATFAVIVAAIFFAWWRNPEFRWNGPWLEICLLLYLLYWLLPTRLWTGTYVYLRLAPFYWVAALAAARVGRRARWLAPLALLLFAVRTAHLARHWVAEQPFLASMARSFEAAPEYARVLPLVGWRGEKKQVLLDYSHFWAYGVIEKRWLVPYLFHDPGVHPLRISAAGYVPEAGAYPPMIYRAPPDWEQVRRDYDYVWAFHVPELDAHLAEIGTLVYQSGELKLYRVRKEGER